MEGSDGEKFDLTPDLQASKLCDGPLFNHPIREFDRPKIAILLGFGHSCAACVCVS